MTLKVSANRLAEFITANSPQRKTSIVRQLIRQELRGRDFVPPYGTFRTPARDYLIGSCQNPNIIQSKINELANRNETPWKSKDSRITTQALQSLLKLSSDIKNLDVEFSRPSSDAIKKLKFGDIEVNIRPDLIVKGERNDVPIFGSLRYYLAKESRYELGMAGAEYVAVMEYLLALENAKGKIAPDTNMCLVLECFQGRITHAPNDPEPYIENIKKCCLQFSQMWEMELKNEAA